MGYLLLIRSQIRDHYFFDSLVAIAAENAIIVYCLLCNEMHAFGWLYGILHRGICISYQSAKG